MLSIMCYFGTQTHNMFSIAIFCSLFGVCVPGLVKVLEVVQSNYDSLTLRLQDSLDQFERYSEKPKEVAFFTSLVMTAVRMVWCCLLADAGCENFFVLFAG